MNSARNCWKINRNLRLTVDNLKNIRADLVKIDNGWKQRKFPQLVEALENQTWKNQMTLRESIFQKSFKANQFTVKRVYCDQQDHKSADFEK